MTFEWWEEVGYFRFVIGAPVSWDETVEHRTAWPPSPGVNECAHADCRHPARRAPLCALVESVAHECCHSRPAVGSRNPIRSAGVLARVHIGRACRRAKGGIDPGVLPNNRRYIGGAADMK